MDSSRRILPALTGMRFFLALWVVAYHQEASVDSFFQPASFWRLALYSVLHTGYAAVGAFFILSGFVLAYNYDLGNLSRRENLKRFAAARFARIYPAYLTGTLLLFPFTAYRLYAGLSLDSGNLSSLLLNLVLLQAWIPQTALTWNYPGWSLSNEAFFYALLPFVGYAIWCLPGKVSFSALRFSLAATLFWLCALAVPLYTVFAGIHGFGDVPATASDFPDDNGLWPGFARYNPLLRLPEFCIGILLARVYRITPPEHWLRNRGYFLYLPAIAAALFLLMNGYRIPYPPVHNGLLAPAGCALILGLAFEGGLPGKLLSSPMFVFLGNASYSMYILHAPLSAYLKSAFVHLFHADATGLPWFLAYLTGVTAVSCVFYKFVEEPAHQYLKQKFRNRATA